MTTTISIPHQCPAHPDDLLAKTTVQAGAVNGVRIVQQWCGHDGCTEALGWQLHKYGTVIRQGSGQCGDRTALDEVARSNRYGYRAMIGGGVALAAMVGLMVAIFMIV